MNELDYPSAARIPYLRVLSINAVAPIHQTAAICETKLAKYLIGPSIRDRALVSIVNQERSMRSFSHMSLRAGFFHRSMRPSIRLL